MTDTLSPVDLPTTASVPVTTPVTAVVVTRGRTGYLATTLRALAAQVRRPTRVLVVDVGASDGRAVGPVLDAAFAQLSAPVPRLTSVGVPRAASFGEAVTAGLDVLERTLGGAPSPWLWLLHDDSAPAPDALAHLVRTVGHAPSVAVAGCKQRTWTSPERLLEVGLRTTRSGRRTTDVEPGELDQGQHDGRSDVLGVGLAGALVRRDVWDALGGTDPALGPFGDGLDLSRRARLAGHRVVVVPAAVVRHAQAAYHGLRSPRGDGGDLAAREVDLDGDGEPDGADPTRSFLARRTSLLHQRLVHAAPALLPLVVLLVPTVAVVRALGQVAAKRPGLAVAELRAALTVLLRPGVVVRARGRARATRVLARRTLHPLQATWRDVWVQARDRRLARLEARRVVRAPSELELRELAALATRRRATLGLVLTVLVVVTVVALGRLLGPVLAGGALTGPALARATTPLADVWAAATSGWVAAGLGDRGPADPLALLLVPLAALGDGGAGTALGLLVLAAVPLAGYAAWTASGAATRSTVLRAWAAVAWAAAPALLLAVGQTRVGAVLVHVALPWVALGLARAVGVQRVDRVLSGVATAVRAETRAAEDDGRTAAGTRATDVTPARGTPAVPHPRTAAPAEQDADDRFVGAAPPTGSVAAAAGAALALAVVLAGAPALLPAVLTVVLAVAATAPRGRRRVLLVPVPSLVLLAPFLGEVARRGTDGLALLVADPGAPALAAPAAGWQRVLGLPADATGLVPQLPGTAALVVVAAPGAVLVLLAVLALLRGTPVSRAVRVCWWAAAAGLATAAVVAAVPAVRTAEGTGPAWTGGALSFAGLGLLAAGLLGADRLRERLAARTFGWRQPAAVLAAALATLVVLAPLIGWTTGVRGAASPGVVSGPVVPAVGQQGAASAAASRVLALTVRTDGTLAWQLLRADGTQLVDQSAAVRTRQLVGDDAEDPATAEVHALVARLSTSTVPDAAAGLAALAVGDVLVPAATDPAADAGRTRLVAALDATPGLERVTHDAAGTLWRVAGSDGDVVTSWARTVPEDASDAAADDPALLAGDAVPVEADRRTVRTAVEDGDGRRVLVLAERSDDGWHAWLDGRPLAPTTVGWRQAFVLGADGGRLVVRHDAPGRTPWLGALGVTVVLTGLLAVPLRRRRGVRT
ncbi:glycosyltransferase [Cellulomonas oligotrophica]|uniref:GT2 family glycosyltransferase n=1 Tax=Cellulomonas oligotrophica TaxID=931536 RepID=A0A7Y9FDZ7_9CELL|nr:glycosyltransferase [Cellulomonas oligotrophica]NYD85212.1 GT2 family glycosyltransferase [Cellulomonas oligotrophica]GIG34188.1 hypothetical protein Col01nite_33470 [Cellulomonas oligotrophica]